MYIRLIRWPGRRHGVCTEALGAKCGTLRHPFAVAKSGMPFSSDGQRSVRRIVVGDEGGRVRHRRACAFLIASFAAGVCWRRTKG
jgi:hypothetical protein